MCLGSQTTYNWETCWSSKMSVKAARRFYRIDSAHDLQFLDSGEAVSTENRWTFEIAWEVANKGGWKYTELLYRAIMFLGNSILTQIWFSLQLVESTL